MFKQILPTRSIGTVINTMENNGEIMYSDNNS